VATLRQQVAQHHELLLAFASAVVKCRRCSECGTLKPLDEFYPREGGHHRICKGCMKQRRRARPSTDAAVVRIALPD